MQIITAPRIKTAGKRATAAPYLNENKSRPTNSSMELNFKTCQTKSYPRSTLQCMHTCQSLSPEIQEVAPETFCRSSSTLLGELVGLGWVGLGWVGLGECGWFLGESPTQTALDTSDLITLTAAGSSWTFPPDVGILSELVNRVLPICTFSSDMFVRRPNALHVKQEMLIIPAYWQEEWVIIFQKENLKTTTFLSWL